MSTAPRIRRRRRRARAFGAESRRRRRWGLGRGLCPLPRKFLRYFVWNNAFWWTFDRFSSQFCASSPPPKKINRAYGDYYRLKMALMHFCTTSMAPGLRSSSSAESYSSPRLRTKVGERPFWYAGPCTRNAIPGSQRFSKPSRTSRNFENFLKLLLALSLMFPNYFAV